MPRLRNYAPLPAAKGDFLFRAGRLAEAKAEFERAAGLTRNARERAFLLAARDGLRRLPRITEGTPCPGGSLSPDPRSDQDAF